jgi:topoisomerase-4 subunit B
LATTPQYSESSIKVLKGLDPVKKSPGMFTRKDCPLHIVQEVLDNGVDEAIGGYAKNVTVELLPNGGVSIEDDGRGIPVGMHPEEHIPVVQAVFTILYAGGKFDKSTGGAYDFSGGLHGVGVSVTNALSQHLKVEVKRDGYLNVIEFADGDVLVPLKRMGKLVDRGELATATGTKVTVYPNPKYFDSADIPFLELRALAKSKAILLPGLTVTVRDLRVEGKHTDEVFHFPDGLVSYLHETSSTAPVTDVQSGQRFIAAGDDTFSRGEGVEWALAWFEGNEGAGGSFVNLIPTPQGGTHVAGLRSALFSSVRDYIDHHGMAQKGVKLTADDVFKNIRYVLSVRMLEVSFDNQTKDKLNTRDAMKLVERCITPSIEAWLNLNPATAKVVAEMALSNANARLRSSQKVERRKSSSVVTLPGKLTQCESQDPAESEIFLVEGDSAGGSAKQGRDKDTQAVLPLRGKGLNVWEKTIIQSLTNEEVRSISIAIGVEPHALEDDVDLSKLRYHRICILSDADVDGFHIQVLLMTLFLRHFPKLVLGGYLYIARPPLYRVDADSAGKGRPDKKMYAMDDAELRSIEERLKVDGYRNHMVFRFKGLGEMNPPALWETTLNPDTRRLLKVQIPTDGFDEALQLFENLMAKGRVDWRREWMERRGHEVAEY